MVSRSSHTRVLVRIINISCESHTPVNARLFWGTMVHQRQERLVPWLQSTQLAPPVYRLWLKVKHLEEAAPACNATPQADRRALRGCAYRPLYIYRSLNPISSCCTT